MSDAARLVARLHGGARGVVAPSAAGFALIGAVGGWADRVAPAWRADPFAALGARRGALGDDRAVAVAVAAAVRALGFGATALVDRPRLRIITADGAPDAAVFVAHRDTWYGCPAGQVNLWWPLDDVGPERAFAFYPEVFARAVPNTSAGFDYAVWQREVGWHGDAPVARYPTVAPGVDLGAPSRCAVRAGGVLLFSGHQLHATQPLASGARPRLSVDVRLVMPGGPEAVRVDDQSQGAAARLAAEFRAVG